VYPGFDFIKWASVKQCVSSRTCSWIQYPAHASAGWPELRDMWEASKAAPLHCRAYLQLDG